MSGQNKYVIKIYFQSDSEEYMEIEDVVGVEVSEDGAVQLNLENGSSIFVRPIYSHFIKEAQED